MTKISLNTTKLGELRFPVSAVNAPEAIIVTGARVSPERDSQGNEIKNSIAKIVLSGVDYKTFQLLKSQGIETDNLTPVTVEFIANDKATMTQVNVQELLGKLLDVRQSEVALKWVSRGNSGSWGGLKLVINQLKLGNMPTK